MCSLLQLDNLKAQQEQIAEHQKVLHEIRISDAEEMCQLKNKLENEIQVWQTVDSSFMLQESRHGMHSICI